MGALRRALFVAATAFACAMVGLALQLVIPAHFVTDGRGAVGSVIGVIALLLALVLGLLIWTSYGVFATQQAESQSLSLTTLQLDYLLEQYGPEATPGRLGLRESVRRSRERYFAGKAPDPDVSFSLARERMHGIDAFFHSLKPEDDERKQILAAAKPMATSIVQTQLLMSRQLVNPVPELLLIMVQVWSSLLFLGFGVMGSASIVSVFADAAGAFAISSAIFLIIEFTEPYSGLFRISSAGIDKVIGELHANAPAPLA
jgi:hypothetical protein